MLPLTKTLFHGRTLTDDRFSIFTIHSWFPSLPHHGSNLIVRLLLLRSHQRLDLIPAVVAWSRHLYVFTCLLGCRSVAAYWRLPTRRYDLCTLQIKGGSGITVCLPEEDDFYHLTLWKNPMEIVMFQIIGKGNPYPGFLRRNYNLFRVW